MCNCNCDCDCGRRNGRDFCDCGRRNGRNFCECENRSGRSMCDRNPRHEHFDRVVARWETVRHYEINSFDTIKPLCTAGLCDERFERMLGRNECECGHHHNECGCESDQEVGVTVV